MGEKVNDLAEKIVEPYVTQIINKQLKSKMTCFDQFIITTLLSDGVNIFLNRVIIELLKTAIDRAFANLTLD